MCSPHPTFEIQAHSRTSGPLHCRAAEGRIYEAYQGLEADEIDPDRIDRTTYLHNFKDFIRKAEPQTDRDKKGNQLYYL